MARHTISEDSTIYHYTLLLRFTRKHPFCWVYTSTLLLWALADAAYLGLLGLLLFLGSLTAAAAFQAGITLLLRRMSPGTVPRLWEWSVAYPFAGYLPAGYVPVGQWSRANLHRLLTGISLIALLYVWLPGSWLANVAAAHILLLLPQLVYIGACKRKLEGGLVKATPAEISLYRT